MYTADTQSRFHDAECEKRLLGSLMMLPECREKILLEADEKYFAYPEHRKLFSIIKKLVTGNIEPDAAVIINELSYTESDITPLQLAELMDHSTTNTAYFMDKFTKDYRLRYYDESLNGSLSARLAGDGVTPEDIEQYLEQLISRGSSECRQTTEVQLDMKKTIDSLGKNQKRGVPTGFKKIDDVINGFANGDLIILGGWTGSGKTALALNIAKNLLDGGERVGMISLEMDEAKISERFWAMNASVDLTHITGDTLDAAENERLHKMYKHMREIENNFYFAPACMMLRDVLLEMRRMKNLHNCSLIVIDYLGLIENREFKNSRYLEICSITRAIKLAAMQLDVPVLLLSQLSRPMKFIKNPESQLGDLRDSGSIEQDADIVMFVYRKDEADDTKRIIKIAKGRNVRTGSIELQFYGKYTQFAERQYG